MMRSITVPLGLAVAVLAAPASPTRAEIGIDPERGVFTLASTLTPIMPGVVQVLVRGGRLEAGSDQLPPFAPGPGVPRLPPQFGGPLPPGMPQLPPHEGMSSGSGVVVDATEGLILTNHHVVEGGDAIRVRLDDGREHDATLVGSDEATDIALLDIDAEGLTSVPTTDSESLQVGDLVVAIGYPFGLAQTVTLGIVSGLGRTGIGTEYEDFIQTDAAINSGNSGGALVDTQGRLIGINTAIFSGQGGGNIGIGYAVPTRIALAVMEQLRTYGEVRRGRLGVSIQDLTPEVASAIGAAAATRGALITQVTENSPGAAAGLQPRDIIIRVDDRMIEGASDLRNAVGLAGADAELVLTVLRDSEELAVTIQLQSAATVAADNLYLLGASFEALPEDHPMRQYVEGVVVSAVEPDSPAARQGLRAGDIVTDLNRAPVPTTEALREQLADLGPVAALTVVRGNSEFLVVLEQGAG
jgi:Do/DeqQ family serine protease